MLKYNLVSLFSGCGGLDLGFHQNGFEVEMACDHFEPAVRVFNRNISNNCFKLDVSSPEFIQAIKSIGNVDVVLGGFPCQGFSKAGPKKENDSRNELYKKMLWAVSTLKPRVFVAENVDGLSQNFGGKVLDQIVSEFSEIGYNVEYRIVDMAWFGVPQHRRRIIFIGTQSKSPFSWPIPKFEQKFRNGDFKFENTLIQSESRPLKTIKDAIFDLQELSDKIPDHKITGKWPSNYTKIMSKIREGQKLCNVRHSPSSVYTWEIPEVFGKVSAKEKIVLETIGKNRRHKKYGNIPNGNPLSREDIETLSNQEDLSVEIDSLIQKNYLKEVSGKYDLKGAMFCSGIFKKPKWLEPSPTVLTNFHNPRYFLHPTQPRPFSLRECARLQGFPDDFLFEETGISLIDGYTLVGNAVPPIFSSELAKAVKQYLTKSAPRGILIEASHPSI